MAAGIVPTFLNFDDVIARINAGQAPKVRGLCRNGRGQLLKASWFQTPILGAAIIVAGFLFGGRYHAPIKIGEDAFVTVDRFTGKFWTCSLKGACVHSQEFMEVGPNGLQILN